MATAPRLPKGSAFQHAFAHIDGVAASRRAYGGRFGFRNSAGNLHELRGIRRIQAGMARLVVRIARKGRAPVTVGGGQSLCADDWPRANCLWSGGCHRCRSHARMALRCAVAAPGKAILCQLQFDSVVCLDIDGAMAVVKTCAVSRARTPGNISGRSSAVSPGPNARAATRHERTRPSKLTRMAHIRGASRPQIKPGQHIARTTRSQAMALRGPYTAACSAVCPVRCCNNSVGAFKQNRPRRSAVRRRVWASNLE